MEINPTSTMESAPTLKFPEHLGDPEVVNEFARTLQRKKTENDWDILRDIREFQEYLKENFAQKYREIGEQLDDNPALETSENLAKLINWVFDKQIEILKAIQIAEDIVLEAHHKRSDD